MFTMKKDSSDSLEFLKFLDQLSSLYFNNLVPHASRVLNSLSSSRWFPMTSGEDDLVDYTDIFQLALKPPPAYGTVVYNLMYLLV